MKNAAAADETTHASMTIIPRLIENYREGLTLELSGSSNREAIGLSA
jgi:hypothetical protein